MSINGLSNHLCLGGAIVAALILGSSFFDRARAADSYAFVESRQFRKNLAASKYRNNAHWLPNYTLKPPETYYGPRKKPPWETNQVPEETKESKRTREEYAEWEKKMREVTKLQREKWSEKSTSEPEESSTTLPDTGIEISPESPMNRYVKSRANSNKSTLGLKNGRWGMIPMRDETISGANASNVIAPGREKEPTMTRLDEGGDVERKRENDASTGKSVLPKLEKNEEACHGKRMSNKMKKKKCGDRTGLKRTRGSRTETPSEMSVSFPPGRWGMSVPEPPTEFLNKIKASPYSEAGNRGERGGKFNGGVNMKDRNISRKKNKKGSRKVSMGLPSAGRWDAGASSSQYLGEIPSFRPPGILGLYQVQIQNQLRADATPINDPRSQQSTIFETSSPLVLFLQMFPPAIFQVRVIPQYFWDPAVFRNRINFPRGCFDCPT